MKDCLPDWDIFKHTYVIFWQTYFLIPIIHLEQLAKRTFFSTRAAY